MLVATTLSLLLHAVSPQGETITVWGNPDGSLTKHHLRVNTEDPIEVNVYETFDQLALATQWHAWVLQGVKSERLEQAIQNNF